VTAQAARPTTAARPGLVNGSRPPAPTFAHLIRLTDDTGLFEHARHAIVRRAHGYCTDDVARGLVVTSREPDPPPAVIRLAECYLAFLTHAQDSDGAFHNRLDFDRRWTDKPGLGDWWGRALWGLGTAVARSPAGWIREEALGAFTAGAARRSSAPHAMAFAGLGAAEVLRVRPDDDGAAGLLADAALAVGVPDDDPTWRWPHPRLSYANAALAEVVILAGHFGDDRAVLRAGLRMLGWLRDIQLVALGALFVQPVGSYRDSQDSLVQARADLVRAQTEQDALKRELRALDTKAALVAEAREQGYVFPGETPYAVAGP